MVKTEYLMKKRLLRDEVKDFLVENILTMKIKTGEIIFESNIAKELGISQSPVREAIRDLVSIGVLEHRPFKGTIVTELTVDVLIKGYEVRIALEQLAIDTAWGNLSEQDLEQMQHLVDEMYEAAKQKNLRRQADFDYEFHYALVRSTNNKLLMRAWESLGVRFLTLIGLYEGDAGKIFDFEQQARRHLDIIAALKSGQRERAAMIMADHFREAKNAILAARKTEIDGSARS